MHLDISQHHMVAWECQAHWVRHTQFKRSWVSLIQKPPFSAGASSEQRDNMIFLLRQKSMPVKMLNAWLPNPSKHFLSKREMMEGARVGDLHVLCQSLGLYCAYCSPPKESFLLSIHPSMYLSPSIQPPMHPSNHSSTCPSFLLFAQKRLFSKGFCMQTGSSRSTWSL